MKKLLLTSSVLAVVAGLILLAGGVWGISFTYSNVARENITTPDDAALPGVPVRGPLSLKAQADVMRVHTLHSTGDKTYAQMPQKVQQVDASGTPMVDAQGNPLMVANGARDIWITYTALTTALNLGIVSYAFSAFTILFGFISLWTGITFYALSKKY